MLKRGFDRASAYFRGLAFDPPAPGSERFPIRWNRLIENGSLRFKGLEHVLIGKVGQLFRNMLEDGQGLDSRKLPRNETFAVIFREFGGL
jgi:hypothetical protein